MRNRSDPFGADSCHVNEPMCAKNRSLAPAVGPGRDSDPSRNRPGANPEPIWNQPGTGPPGRFRGGSRWAPDCFRVGAGIFALEKSSSGLARLVKPSKQ
jgi:hypothetical protein